VCDGKADFFSDVDGSQQGALLMTRGTRTALLARKGNEHLVPAVRATNSSKTFLQISTLEIGCYRPLNNGPPEAVLGLKSFIVVLLERVKMLVDQTPQFGCTRIPWFVQHDDESDDLRGETTEASHAFMVDFALAALLEESDDRFR